jgi:hypothetical protein
MSTVASTIRRTVLLALRDTYPFLLPETSLFADMSNRLATPVTFTEFRQALSDLEAQRRVVSQRDEDQNLKWKITDNGLARLAELV